MNVAQLKHLALQLLACLVDQFPRLNERGSIEAGASAYHFAITERRFPRLNERGSIEAQNRQRFAGFITEDVSTFE